MKPIIIIFMFRYLRTKGGACYTGHNDEIEVVSEFIEAMLARLLHHKVHLHTQILPLSTIQFDMPGRIHENIRCDINCNSECCYW